MKNGFMQLAEKQNDSRKKRKGWRSIVRVLGAAVVFCTTYALILPAITMQHETVCGMEEHTHGEECYTVSDVYTYNCGIGADVTVLHTHNERCLDGNGNLVCPLPEIEHIHGEACYQQTETLICENTHLHSESCTTETVLVCGKEETQGHTHGEGCVPGTRQKLICQEDHTHADACYETEQVACVLEEKEAHTHDETCSEVREVTCPLPDGAEHVHDESCYELTKELICTRQEFTLHAHADACYDAEGNLTCTLEEHVLHTHGERCYDSEGNLTCQLPQIMVHAHEDSCLTVLREQQVLTCQLSEHTHEDSCYPAEAEDDGESTYICGLGVHAHGEACLDEAGEIICSVPEHAHGAGCIVKDLDMSADLETPLVWEQTLQQLYLTGDWSADVVAVAQSQLGYRESARNVVLENEELRGYSRYGAWYGEPYGEWSAEFAAFCLHYAWVEGFPLNADADLWMEQLKNLGLYAAAGTYTAKSGDLIFFDHDRSQDAPEEAGVTVDRVGIVIAQNGEADTQPGKIKVIEGDAGNEVAYVTYDLSDPAIIGYGIIPENPLSPEEWRQAYELSVLASQLPDAEQTRQELEELNRQGDQLGFEALRQELISRMEPIQTQYDSLNELQKEWIGSLDNLNALQEICGGAAWQTLPRLEDDSALVTELTAGQAEVVAGPDRGTYSQMALDNRTRSVHDGDTLRYPFTVAMESYYTDIAFGEARIKVELVLPLSSEQAVLDAGAMSWLEDSELTLENRMINGSETLCQVLTGYKRVVTDEHTVKVVPGTFTEEVVVNVLDMSHGQRVAVIISAAMEHGHWNGTCEDHGVEEKLTVVTQSFILYEPLTEEEQLEVYRDYLAQMDALAAPEDGEEQLTLDELESRIHDSYCAGALSDDQYSDLYQRLLQLSGLDLQSIAEPSKGDGWIWLDISEPGYSTDTAVLYSSASVAQAPVMMAMPRATYARLGLDSNSQIPADGWGGENSEGDVIWVSKTIEGTEQENVFDITLQIITKEEINEVYEEPDMAVVVVMDISNTMVSVFSGETTVTRYDAAMDAAEQFMHNFAAETEGVSKLGYVAFNTHGHEVFPMQLCSTTAQANNLATTMRNKTKKIMDDAAAAAGGKYASSHERFTNIEAGLKMAADMLEGVNNRHKYIIFLSDGFPTTYISSGYRGYDPYTGSGSNGTNGVFYDRVMGVHCDYGTSYSDTAAIKARQMAVSLKDEGINIFSIGVDVEGQTIWEYHWDSSERLKTASTVERRQNANYYNTTGYEIGTLHSEITAYPTVYLESIKSIDETKLPASARQAMSQDFKNWLKGTKSSGIGSGYYFESTDQQGLEAAYDQIFQEILYINAESSRLDWVATDPMPGMGVHELETIEFIGFWDLWSDDPTLVNALSGKSQDSSLYYNSATFDTAKNTINWDLKNSGYQSVSMGNNKNFMCALKYRVRLMNEETGFVEKAVYDTNDKTFLTYRIIEVVNNETKISDQKKIEFPIPKVFGYLSELNFLKVDPTGAPLEGAKFALTHDTASCGTCRGDGKGHVELPVYEAVSDQEGKVSFTNIPSGHSYILTETEAPEAYLKTTNHYYVTVSYDALTVTVTDADGNPLEWVGSIENDTHYILPNTGGAGTSFHTFGGLLFILAGACGYIVYTGRKQGKGGRYHR